MFFPLLSKFLFIQLPFFLGLPAATSLMGVWGTLGG
jgi:hypothetical protein